MRITDEIFQTGGGGLTSQEDASIYLIRYREKEEVADFIESFL